MRFTLNKNARFPRDKKLCDTIESAASKLVAGIVALDVMSLDISDYNKRFMVEHKRKLQTRMQRLAYVFAWAASSVDKPFSKMTIVDYGGGTGFLSLLAKECGVGTVLYNDIFDTSCRDAEVIAKVCGNLADHYIPGDMDSLLMFVKKHSLSCDLVLSSDVIEHIYRIDDFFSALGKLSSSPLSIAFATHANPCNPFVSRMLAHKHKAAENDGRQNVWGHKESDSLSSWYSLRRKIIEEYAGERIPTQSIEILTKMTRGLMKVDIIKCIDRYLQSRELPNPPAHPTNTCDPITGNWADRLTNPYELKELLEAKGFCTQVLCCHYGTPSGIVRRMMATLLDRLISKSTRMGLQLAPSFMLLGRNQGRA